MKRTSLFTKFCFILFSLVLSGGFFLISDLSQTKILAQADITAPIISNGSPTGFLSPGTSSVTVSVSTNEPATCAVSSTANTNYESMTLFSVLGTNHSFNATPLSDGVIYTRYIRCKDAAGNANSSDYSIVFSVNEFLINDRVQVSPSATNVRSSPGGASLGTQNPNSFGTVIDGPNLQANFSWWNINYDTGVDGWTADVALIKTIPQDTSPPNLSNGSPQNTLPQGTTITTMSLTTNENAACRFSTTPNISYEEMPNIFSSSGSTSHSTTISGLLNGTTYNYYVRCKDTAGNTNSTDYQISFSVNKPSSDIWIKGPCTATNCYPDNGLENAVVWNDKLIIIGKINSIDGVSVKNIAAWDKNNWLPLGAGLNDSGEALAIYNGELIAGGQMTATADGATALSRIGRWDGTSWKPLGAGLNGVVRALYVFNNELIAGGHFTSAGGVSVKGVVSGMAQLGHLLAVEFLAARGPFTQSANTKEN